MYEITSFWRNFRADDVCLHMGRFRSVGGEPKKIILKLLDEKF